MSPNDNINADSLLPLKNRFAVARDTMAFEFDLTGAKDFTWRAGQNADFTLVDPPETDAEGNIRTFSLASAPERAGSFFIATRMRPTAFKRSLQKMPLGTRVRVSRPGGSFTLHKDVRKMAVLVAGGIGVTPIRAIIESWVAKKLEHRIVLFYSNRTPEDTAFLKDFEEWQKRAPNFKLAATVTQPGDSAWPYERGRIDAAMIKKYVPEMDDPIFYIAGPPAMVAALKDVLIRSGAPEDNLRSEEFSGY